MPRIAILPSAVADQIAAGEVVERPASVVKELVENALDAGAAAIDVAIEDGGRKLIRVSDDGGGMARDDAQLALARHATSKLRAAQELVGIGTFGFRGEALPAICSVSRLELETSPDDGDGTLIRAEGGRILEVRDAARRRGTTVSVAHLFYNAPARQKFVRSARSEWRGIAEAITAMALVRRDVRVTLAHDGRVALTLPPASALRARAAALWGARFADRLLDVDDVMGTTHVSGLVERPADVGTAGRRTFLSVNGRAVRDAGIIRAAETAYRSTIPAGARPTILLELTLPADAVDVNVHPAKAEIRLRDRWPVERAVEMAVRRALGTPDAAAFVGQRGGWAAHPGSTGASSGTGAPDVELLSGPAPATTAELVPDNGDSIPVPPLFQLRRMYIAFEHDDGIVLIDQHSAHERVLFERFMRTLQGGGQPAQRLLFPLTMHLGPAEEEAFEINRELFERLGFEIEGFGGHTLIVRAVPMPHPRFDAARCLRETLDALTGDRVAGAAARHERLAATVACKAAIKAGDALSPGEMRALYLALGETTLPAHDVHGRSTIVQLSWDEIDRRFGRR